LLQQEDNPAATGNVNYYVDYNLWTFLYGLMEFSKGKIKSEMSVDSFVFIPHIAGKF
jgi:hypothetical protein